MKLSLRQFFITASLLLIGCVPSLAAETLTLEAALGQLSRAPDWQSADLTYLTAQRSLESARAAAGLKVSTGADASGSLPLSGSGSSSGSVSVNASASLTVLPWSSTFDAVRSAERALYRAGLDRADARKTLALNVVQQYFAARVAALDLASAQASESLAAQQVAVSERQLQNGQVSKESADSTRKSYENAKLTTLQAQQNLELTRLQLFQTLGAAPSDAVLGSAAAPRAVPAGTLEALTAAALKRRSDVLKAQSRVDDAVDSLQSAQRDRWLPNASVGASVGNGGASGGGSSVSGSLNIGQGTASLSGQAALTGGNTGATSLTLTASLSVPVLNPAADAKISSAAASLESARQTLQSTQQSAALDVRQKYNDASLQLRKLEYSRTVLTNAQNSLAITQKRLELGSVTALEVTQAAQTVRQAERDLESQISSELLAAYRLENAIGALGLAGE